MLPKAGLSLGIKSRRLRSWNKSPLNFVSILTCWKFAGRFTQRKRNGMSVLILRELSQNLTPRGIQGGFISPILLVGQQRAAWRGRGPFCPTQQRNFQKFPSFPTTLPATPANLGI